MAAKKKAKKKNVIERSGDLVKSGAHVAVKGYSVYGAFIEKAALVIGVLGFLATLVFGAIWLTYRMRVNAEVSVDLPLTQSEAAAYLTISVFCASFIGFLLVNDGQGRIDKKIPDWFSTLAFGILPLLCLLSTVLSGKLPEWFGFIPEQEAQPYHPYWAFVRFYPLVLTALCLAMAFKAAAKPRKYMKKKRALKFLMLALPYVIVMIYSELSLKSGLVEEGLDKTIGEGGLNLGALGVNVQLILALMTGSRLE